MLHFLDPFRDFTLASVALRMLLTVLCGGLIGIERAFKRRSAGFRTHILICLGAAMTTMTSLYLVLVMHYYTDLARLGAQVIAGIGFIASGRDQAVFTTQIDMRDNTIVLGGVEVDEPEGIPFISRLAILGEIDTSDVADPAAP